MSDASRPCRSVYAAYWWYAARFKEHCEEDLKKMVTPSFGNRTPFVYLDFCFYEFCNFTCTYCRDSNREMSRGQGRADFDRAIADFLKLNSAAVLKVSGYGEATLWPDLPDVLHFWASSFPTVQLISNGAGPPDVLERLCELPNFQVCITLDGHTPEMNRFRTKGDVYLHDRVVKTVDRLVALGKPVELNCVITAANASLFREYLSWVSANWGAGVKVIPFPVRLTLGREKQNSEEELDATLEQITKLEDVIVHQHADFFEQLPPLAYSVRLIEFMRTSRRAQPCHIHRANFGVNTKFQALACACAGDRLIKPFGEIAAVGFDPEVEQRRAQYLRDGNVGAKCSTCFTHYDIVNLYFEELISDDEIRHIPSLRAPETLAYLHQIKKELQPYL